MVQSRKGLLEISFISTETQVLSERKLRMAAATNTRRTQAQGGASIVQHTVAQGCPSLGVTSQQKAQPLAQLLNEGQGRDAGGGSARGLWEPGAAAWLQQQSVHTAREAGAGGFPGGLSHASSRVALRADISSSCWSSPLPPLP